MSKLVRDKIPEILEKRGIKTKTRILSDNQEYLSALCEKLLEEANEFIEVSTSKDDDRVKEELADVLEVIYAIGKLKEFDFNSLNEIREKKRLERGGFEKRILSVKIRSN